MTLQKFFIIGLLVFLLGLTALYTGINRAPFREAGGHPSDHSSLQNRLTPDEARCLPEQS